MGNSMNKRRWKYEKYYNYLYQSYSKFRLKHCTRFNPEKIIDRIQTFNFLWGKDISMYDICTFWLCTFNDKAA